jgi:hypothetical protein
VHGSWRIVVPDAGAGGWRVGRGCRVACAGGGADVGGENSTPVVPTACCVESGSQGGGIGAVAAAAAASQNGRSSSTKVVLVQLKTVHARVGEVMSRRCACRQLAAVGAGHQYDSKRGVLKTEVGVGGGGRSVAGRGSSHRQAGAEVQPTLLQKKLKSGDRNRKKRVSFR